MIEERRAKKVRDDVTVRQERLSSWWRLMHDRIPIHRERRHLYKVRASRMMSEIDVKLSKEADERDAQADLIAETARNKKRKQMAANRRRR